MVKKEFYTRTIHFLKQFKAKQSLPIFTLCLAAVSCRCTYTRWGGKWKKKKQYSGLHYELKLQQLNVTRQQ